jgi:hypothetical protein
MGKGWESSMADELKPVVRLVVDNPPPLPRSTRFLLECLVNHAELSVEEIREWLRVILTAKPLP